MKNLRIKKALASNMMRHWQLARLLNVSEMTLTRKLREELPEEEQLRIVKLIENAAKESKSNE